MPLDDILQHGQHLPAIPRVVMELLATFKRDDCNADDIARLISADAVLSAKVLRLANSAIYKRSRSITSVRQATVIVGYVPLRLLVAGLGVAGGVPDSKGFDRKRFWHYSLNTAVIARHLAPAAGVDAEAAFSTGLLHAVGHPVIRAALPDAATALEALAPFYARERAALERERWGFDYAQVGGRLAESWSFPAALVTAIGGSAQPLQSATFEPLTGLVRIAADIAGALEPGLAQAETIAFVDRRVLERVRLSVDHLRAVPPVETLAAGLESLFE